MKHIVLCIESSEFEAQLGDSYQEINNLSWHTSITPVSDILNQTLRNNLLLKFRRLLCLPPMGRRPNLNHKFIFTSPACFGQFGMENFGISSRCLMSISDISFLNLSRYCLSSEILLVASILHLHSYVLSPRELCASIQYPDDWIIWRIYRVRPRSVS